MLIWNHASGTIQNTQVYSSSVKFTKGATEDG